jgi:hypothetical protein
LKRATWVCGAPRALRPWAAVGASTGEGVAAVEEIAARPGHNEAHQRRRGAGKILELYARLSSTTCLSLAHGLEGMPRRGAGRPVVWGCMGGRCKAVWGYMGLKRFIGWYGGAI